LTGRGSDTGTRHESRSGMSGGSGDGDRHADAHEEERPASSEASRAPHVRQYQIKCGIVQVGVDPANIRGPRRAVYFELRPIATYGETDHDAAEALAHELRLCADRVLAIARRIKGTGSR